MYLRVATVGLVVNLASVRVVTTSELVMAAECSVGLVVDASVVSGIDRS